MNDELNKEITVPAYLKISKVISWLLYIWVIYGVIVLSIRVFLLAFSANPATPFVQFIYNTSADYLAPFRGIFPTKPVGETGYLDVASLFAIIIYLLFVWLVSAAINYVQSKIDVLKEEEKDRESKLQEIEMAKALEETKTKKQTK
jgi:uncharacterized protein YggT (Ycf19 family)